MTTPLTLTLVDSFASLRPAWDALVTPLPSCPIFLSWEWQEHWWRCLGDGALSVLVAWSGPDVIGIAPLVRIDDDLGSRWEFAGGAEVADFLDVIARADHEAEIARALLSALATRGGRLHLRNLRPDSFVITRLVPEARRARLEPIVEVEDVSPRVALPATWDAYLQSLSKKDRHELRRKIRRLFAAGAVDYGPVAPGDYGAADLADFVRLHRLSTDAKARFMTPAMERFFGEVLATFIPRDRARLYFLRIDARRVAAAIIFHERTSEPANRTGGDQNRGGSDRAGAFWLYNSGYDPDFAPLSVGLLLKAFCLRDAIEEGKETFDFLQGPEPYKYDLGGDDTPIYRLRLDLGLPARVLA